ncbi:YcnI family protein [Streptomyces sp. HK10]|uniref:YcnI family protein n=1 Tax=Streptomyces sp. HK10 TaxID=3373255 RepID=UPI003748CCB1
MRHALRRGTLAAVSAGALLLAAAGPAAAHITVDPRSTEAGGWAKLTFRVPTERPDDATVRVEVVLPQDQPLASLSVRPTPGWKAEVKKRKLSEPLVVHGDRSIDEVVSRIVWTGGEIRPGEFQEFDVSAGPLPEDADRMVFKTLQTYDSGEVVRWIEEPAEGGEEPERPAPVLALTPAAAAVDDAPSEAAADDAPAASEGSPEAAAPAAEGTQDAAARLLGGAGLGAGLAGLLAAVAVRRRTGRTTDRAGS